MYIVEYCSTLMYLVQKIYFTILLHMYYLYNSSVTRFDFEQICSIVVSTKYISVHCRVLCYPNVPCEEHFFYCHITYLVLLPSNLFTYK